MPGFTPVFGGSAIYQSNLTYRAFSIASDTQLQWPTEISSSGDVAADLMDVTPSGAAWNLDMPAANATGAGKSCLIYNDGVYTLNVRDYDGGAICSIGPGQTWQVYLRTNTTAAGTWRAILFGAGTNPFNAASLASGQGITSMGSQLLAQVDANTTNASSYALGSGNRGSAVVSTGAAATFSVDASATTGDGWFCYVVNAGSGALDITPTSDTIDGVSSVALEPGDGVLLLCDGTAYYTMRGIAANPTSFTFLAINVAGTGTYTLNSVEAGKTALEFTGLLTGNRIIDVPATVNEYWVYNNTTGSYTLTMRVAGSAGATVACAQGGTVIVYSDGTNIINASSGGISVPVAVAQGGTGATTQSGARTNLGATATGAALFTAASAAAGRTTLAAAPLDAPVFTTSITGPNVDVTGTTVPANGIYEAAANVLTFSANSTRVGSFNGTGLAIGTGAATAKLDVDGDINVTASTDNRIGFGVVADTWSNGGVTSADYGMTYNAGTVTYSGKSGIAFATNDAVRATLDTSGNLTVSGSTTPVVAIGSTSAAMAIVATSGTASHVTQSSGSNSAVHYFQNDAGATEIGRITANDTGLFFGAGGDTSSLNMIPGGAVGVGITANATISVYVAKSSTGATTTAGVRVSGTVQSDVTSAHTNVLSVANTQAASFTLTTYSHFNAQGGTVGAASAITTQQGFVVSSNMSGGANNRAFVGALAEDGANDWNLYMSGTARNYIAGAVGIGSTSNLDVSNLVLARSIGGAATSYGILHAANVANTVSTFGYGYYSQIGTEALAAITSLAHVNVVQGTFSGTSVANQYGFRVNSTLTGATTINAAYSGEIASGATRWNLYMSGTAQNYLRGNVGIGSGKTAPAEALDIAGNIALTGDIVAVGTVTAGGTLLTGNTGTVTSVSGTSGLTGSVTTSGNISVNTNNSVGVGAYAILQNQSGGAVSNGSTTAGSNLRMMTWSGAGTFITGAAPSGTWRNVSGVSLANNDIGMWIRTA